MNFKEDDRMKNAIKLLLTEIQSLDRTISSRKNHLEVSSDKKATKRIIKREEGIKLELLDAIEKLRGMDEQ
jgi:hypothetical protein